MGGMFRRLPLYPILFAIFPVLSLTAYNLGEISLDVILRPLWVSLFIGGFLFVLARWILQDWDRAALAVLVALFLFFLYGQVYNLLEDVTFGGVSIFRHRTLLPLFGLALAVLLYLIWRRLHQPRRFTPWLNFLSIFLLIYPSSKIVWSVFQQTSADRSVRASYSQVTARAKRPDIYYIILDGYGRADILQELLGYDNSEFLNALRQRGFYIADCSQSNYAYTEFSLASSLNYNYLDNLNVHNRSARIALIKHSAMRSFLEANGYKIVAFPTGWAFTEWRDADLYLDYEHPVTSLTEFESLLLNTTALRVITNFQIPDQSGASHKDFRRLRVFSLLDKIKKLPELDEDLFVFAHLVVPHFPYTFGPNGEVPAYQGKNAAYQETAAAYLDQVKFLNKEILKVIDALMENSDVPPIIILQSDHGPLPDLTTEGWQRMLNLSAYYLPGMQMDKILYSSMTPVNSFRVVLNSYFDQSLPLLEDHSYFAPGEDRYDYQEVPNTCPDKP
jgi:hypothetical protein